MSTAADVAEAVKDALAAATFTQEITADRMYVPEIALASLGSGGVRVLVVPVSDAHSLASRGIRENDITVDVAVYKKLAAATDPTDPAKLTEIDGLIALTREIAESLGPTAPTGLAWLATNIDPVFDSVRLHKERLFASLITVTYRQHSSL